MSNVSDALPDKAARDRIREDLDSTLFVEAGAGTGKTRELVQRILGLIIAGRARMPSIAAITFTEAAAVELRDRVREALERAARDESLPPGERDNCRAAAGEVDAAAIETLHGFAQRILASYPLEAGLPPIIEVQDEIRASIAFGEEWDEFVDRLLDDPAMERPLLRAFVLGLRVGQLREVAREFHRHWDRLEDVTPDEGEASQLDPSPLLSALSEVCGLAGYCNNREDLLLRRLKDLERYRLRLEAAADELDALRILAEKTAIKSRGGNQSNWSGIRPGQVRDMLTEAHELRAALLAAARRAALLPLLASLRRFVLEYADERRRQGKLEFHDLLVQARDLLRRNPVVRRSLRQRFSHLLIDEFQDTDPLQIDIAVLLASRDAAGASLSWQEAEVEEGRLFFVGDPKQSIYRFRRADIALYQAVQRRFEADTVRLTQNFRSLRPVLEWVNDVFAALVGRDPRDGQAAYQEIFAGWEPPSGTPTTVRVLGEPSGGNMDSIRAREAGELAGVIRSIRAEGWPVSEKGEDGGLSFRPARYADIAVLMPTRTALPPLEQALEDAGIPYRVESRSLVYSAQEVRDLLTVLRAIDDPTDEVALVAALRSPAFGCSDVDLFQFWQAGGRWDYRGPPPSLPPGHPVVAAMDSLRKLHERRRWEGINGIVEGVIRERRLFELAFAHRRPRERWQRLRFLLDQARAFVEAGGSTLRQFIDWAEQQAEEGTRVVETVVPEADDDAVRIMTIHASKGLEFPIVALVGLNVDDQARHRGAVVFWDKDGRPEARLGPQGAQFETAGFEQSAAFETEMDAYEKVRLLYVATTRARDHLILSLHHKEASECHGARLWERCLEAPHLWRRLGTAEVTGPPAEERETRPFEDSPERRAQWLGTRERLLDTLSRAPVLSATALDAEGAETAADPNLQKDAPVEEIPPWRRGRAGTSLGRAVHAVLQSIDLATGEGLQGAARAQAAAEGIPERAAEVEHRVSAALGAPSVREAVTGRYWREVYVAVPVNEIVLEGFIDLLYETERGLIIVDYKTDAVPGEEEMAQAMARYRLQGAAYALAVEQALGKPVLACRFVFVQPGEAREQPLENLPAAMQRVRKAVDERRRLSVP